MQHHQTMPEVVATDRIVTTLVMVANPVTTLVMVANPVTTLDWHCQTLAKVVATDRIVTTLDWHCQTLAKAVATDHIVITLDWHCQIRHCIPDSDAARQDCQAPMVAAFVPATKTQTATTPPLTLTKKL